MNFSLQEMVQRTIAESERRVKLASDDTTADGEESKPSTSGAGPTKPPAPNPNTTPDRNEPSIGEKVSSANITTKFVEKLAGAVEYINEHLLKKVADGEGAVGAGTGPNALETNLGAATPGTQNYQFGQATAQNQPPKNPGSATAAEPGNTAPKTSLDNDYDKKPGGTEDWTNKDVLKQGSADKTASQISRVVGIMKKMASDVPPDASASEESVPALPGPAAAQAKLVASNEAAKDYTKRDAKAEPKERMGEVLSEPAQVTSTDPVLQNNLSTTLEAGTKISSVKTAAAARALLQKIAEEGCAEGASSEARGKAEKLKELLAKQKTSDGMPIGGGF